LSLEGYEDGEVGFAERSQTTASMSAADIMIVEDSPTQAEELQYILEKTNIGGHHRIRRK